MDCFLGQPNELNVIQSRWRVLSLKNIIPVAVLRVEYISGCWGWGEKEMGSDCLMGLGFFWGMIKMF